MALGKHVFTWYLFVLLITGTLAKDINFQVFLLDGVFRWNCDREIAAVDSNTQDKLTPKTYSGPLKNAVNKLAEDVMGKAVFENYKPPGKYTGRKNCVKCNAILIFWLLFFF
jgi:hypothetical protein